MYTWTHIIKTGRWWWFWVRERNVQADDKNEWVILLWIMADNNSTKKYSYCVVILCGYPSWNGWVVESRNDDKKAFVTKNWYMVFMKYYSKESFFFFYKNLYRVVCPVHVIHWCSCFLCYNRDIYTDVISQIDFIQWLIFIPF